MTESDLVERARRLAESGSDAEASLGRTVRVVADEAIRQTAREAAGAGDVAGSLAAAKRALELALLERGAFPRRYLRNFGTLGFEGQTRLLEATVGVAGLGGLGGYVTEILARAGVGQLVVLDPDLVTDDNLNRQALATEDNLGQAKVDVARARLAAVNSAVTVRAHGVGGTFDDFRRLFAGTTVIVDALDSVPARFDLQRAATALGTPLVHGAIAGLYGQVTTVFPGDPGLELLYAPEGTPPGPGVEALVGNLSPTPAVIAALEAQEVIKVITGVGRPLRRKLLVVDSLSAYAAVVEL